MITETYISGSGPLYRMDPRPKFILLLFFVIFFLLESSPALQAGMLAFLLLLCGTSFGFRGILIPVKTILPVLILTALLTPPFNRTGDPLLIIGDFTVVTGDGVSLTVLLLMRFTGITTAFYLFFSSTRTNPMILALRSFGLPFKAALTVTISLRYIPYMFVIYERITDAHKLRTARMGGGEKKGFRYRLSGLFPVLTSVLIQAVKGIPSLAMALDSKGFGRKNPRSSCRKLPPWRDIVMQLAASVILCAVLTTASVLF